MVIENGIADMKKLLLIDHEFHKKTRSSDFFIDILRPRFDVTVLYLSPEEIVNSDLLDASGKADLIVLWQLDFLAPVFLAQGKPTIVIPMYDGSHGMPNLHWLMAHGARHLNFSLALHHRVRMLGCESMLVRYYPKPVAEHELPRFDKMSAFFWQRRPDHGIDFDYVDALIGDDLDALHVHNAADVPWRFAHKEHKERRYSLTTSEWFPSKSGYVAQLAKANVFVAPRASEGIGMAQLEAMARGMLVLAHDQPTNNEYIANFLNGILFNKNEPAPSLHIRTNASVIGRMAWETVREGHKKWIASFPQILDWIDQAPKPLPVHTNLRALLMDTWFSYYASLDDYSAFLRRNIALMSNLSGLSFAMVAQSLRLEDPSYSSNVTSGTVLSANALLDRTHPAASGKDGSGPEQHDLVELRAQLQDANLGLLEMRARLRSAERALGAVEGPALDLRLPPVGSIGRAKTVVGLVRSLTRPVARLVNQGNIRRDAHDWAAAADFYEQAVAANPQNGPIWVQLGNMHKEAGKYDLAAQAYKHAVNRMPRNSDVYLQIGHLRKLMGNTQGAQQAYRAAIACKSNNQSAIAELRSIENKTL